MRLATWNIHNGIPAGGGDVDTALLRTSAASLDAEVLALQEVDRGQPRSGLADQAAEVAEEVGATDWRYVPTLVGTPPQRWRSAGPEDEADAAPAYGVALISQHPVRSWHVLRMQPGPLKVRVERGSQTWWAGDEPRVAVAAVLQSPHGPMTVVSTHLSFLPGPNVRQLRRLVRWVHGLPAPRVVLGDLNIPGALVARLSGLEVLGRAPTHPAHAPRLQLDHALGHGDLPPARAQTRVLPVSDHLALTIDLPER